ncbi:NAD(P)-dependent alcohol dehydrogenase [Glycomyces paridis]|uniref:NAD(P)-dependent alcohol dehydrogenase n=1 Tax=Glycomyces paridis TaxID=2126555 RepID=A0A4S8PHG7_9ACTN|nr:NAD(P)-dependent alcohol dehydrogenase [Glycomyces paridis]THV29055.1 NAD(P)-dependent alcohol dehydrogenase [Glycomyces paridis]
MKAVLQDRYGNADAVRVGELAKPVPSDDEVLIRIRAASLNGSDRENLVGSPLYARLGGLRRPRHPVPGSDVSGVVETVGKSVSDFEPGEAVFGELAGYRGGLAEYVATPPRLLARKPPGLSYAEAAAIPQAGCIAYRSTRGIEPGERVLVNGGGGAGGAMVIGLAKHFGATVTAVDRADKAAFLLRAGADQTIDYAESDWAAEEGRYDRIVDLVAHRSPYRVRRALRPGGSYLMVGGHARILLATAASTLPIRWTAKNEVKVLVVPQSREDLEAVTALVTEGAVAPITDRTFPLDAAAEAFARLASGDNQGKIVIEVP